MTSVIELPSLAILLTQSSCSSMVRASDLSYTGNRFSSWNSEIFKFSLHSSQATINYLYDIIFLGVSHRQ